MTEVIHIVGLLAALGGMAIGARADNRDDQGRISNQGRVIIALAVIVTIANAVVYIDGLPSEEVRRLQGSPVASLSITWVLPANRQWQSELSKLEKRFDERLEECQGSECWWGLERRELVHTRQLLVSMSEHYQQAARGAYTVLISVDQTLNGLLISKEPNDAGPGDSFVNGGFRENQLAFRWDIEPGNLSTALHRANPEVPFSTDFADILKVAVVFDADDPRYSEGGISVTGELTNLWEVNTDGSEDVKLNVKRGSTVTIKPNGLDLEFEYVLVEAYGGHLVDLEMLEELESRRLIFIFELQDSPFD